jgi:putative ABC transport system permease protein
VSSRPVRPRLGRTQLRKAATSPSQPQDIASSSVAPVEPITVSTLSSLETKEAQEASALQMSPSTENDLPVVPIVDQPTASIPPTPVKAHPELSAGFPTVDEELSSATDDTADDGLPVWEMETIPVPAPRPIPEVKEGAGKETPLEVMLRDLRVRKPKAFRMIRTSSRSALESIWLNRLTSLLTTLSIVIGVAAVIITLILTQGASAYFTDVLVGVGNSSVVIDAGMYNNGLDVTSQPERTLSLYDVQVLAKVQHVEEITPIINLEQEVGFNNQSQQINVQGVSPALQDIQGWELQEGIWFSSADDAGTKQVAVIGSDLAQQYVEESGLDPLGQNILIGTESFRVVGVLAPQGGYKVDDVVFIPTNTALIRLSDVKGIDRIEIKLDNSTDIDLTMEKMVNILRKNHNLPPGGPADFQMNTGDQLIQITLQELQAMKVLLIGSAIILLVAGGIGIINIMLASVTRRTREIGVRIAVGARRSDIRNQFLIEAMLLSLAGGGLGMLGGLGVGFELMKIISGPFIVTTVTYVMPFAIALFIGIVFGLYPAIRAARLEPVIALQRSWA